MSRLVAALLPDAGAQQIGVLRERQEERHEVIRAHWDIPAHFQGPGDDRLAKVGRGRAERRRRNRECRLPLWPAQIPWDGRLEEGVVGEEGARWFQPSVRCR
jgi:hypothetical protein